MIDHVPPHTGAACDDRRAGGLRRSTAGPGICQLTLDRPERLNSFTARDYGELCDALEQCALRRHQGSHPHGHRPFLLVGADRTLLDRSATDVTQHAGRETSRLLQALIRFPKPLLEPINGLAVGFGCTMLLYADLILVAKSARLRLPFTALGIVPEAGSSALLPTRSRLPDVMWAVLSSDWIDAGRPCAPAWHGVWSTTTDSSSKRSKPQVPSPHSDPSAVAATKRLMTAGREALARDAISRELDEYASTLGAPSASDMHA